MKKLKQFSMLLMCMAALSLITSCDQNDDDDATVRDATVSWTLTGACTQSETVLYAENKPTSTATISVASYNSAGQALSVVFTELGLAWNWGWSAENVSQIQPGTYSIALGGGYGSSCAAGFNIVSGELHITSVASAADVGNPNDKYITGTITIVYENGDTPPATFTLQGSFNDLRIAAS